MNFLKKTAAILASAMLLLTGCGGNNQGSGQNSGSNTTAKGRYIETDITPTKMDFNTIMSIQAQKDGSLNVFGYNIDETDYYQVTTLLQMRADAEGNWSTVDTSWYSNLLKQLEASDSISMPMSAQMDADGNTFLILNVQREIESNESDSTDESITSMKGNTRSEFHLVKVNKNGEISEITIPEFTSALVEYGGATGIELLENGDFLINYMSESNVRILYGPDGTQKGSFMGNYRADLAVLPEALVQPSTQNSELLLYQYAKAKPYQAPAPAPATSGDSAEVASTGNYQDDEGITADEKIPVSSLEEALVTGGSDGAIYTMRRDGVTRNMPGGTLTETVMDGGGYSFGFPSSLLRQFEAAENGNFYLLANTVDGQKVYRYSYDKTADSAPGTEIVLFSMRDSYTVRQAIAQFQRQYPEARINHQVGITDDGNRTVDDVIRSLNTELLAGKGPDILILDELPVDALVNKGMLSDLTGKVSTEGMFPGVAKAFERNGKLYALPGKLKLPLLSARPEDIAGVKTLEDFVKKIESDDTPYSMDEMNKIYETGAERERTPYTTFDSPTEMFELLYPVSSDSIIANNKIDETALREFLTLLNRIKVKYAPAWPEDAFMTNGGGMVSMSSVASSSSGSFYSLTMALMEYWQGNVDAALNNYSSMACVIPGFYANIYTYNVKTGKPELKPGRTGEGDFVFMPALTEKNRFIPTSVAAVNVSSKYQDLAIKFVNTMLTSDVQKTEFDDGLPVNREAFSQVLDKNLKDDDTAVFARDLVAYCDTLDTAVIGDSLLTEVIQTETVSYLEGEKSLDEAVTEIQSKTKTYFAERS